MSLELLKNALLRKNEIINKISRQVYK
jgi:hypothetical protein